MFLKGRGIVGLDIGAHSIKVLQLKDRPPMKEVKHIGIAEVPPDIVVEGEIMDAITVIDIIKNLFDENNISSREVVAAVSGASVIIKKIRVPYANEEEFRESAKLEADQYIPFDIEEVNLDFQILPQEEGSETMDVLLVAVKKDKIELITSLLTGAGLTPVIVDVDAFAVENQFEYNYGIQEDKNIALVNIGAEVTNINIVRGEFSIFTRNAPLGGKQYTRLIQENLGIEYESAEKIKRGEKTFEEAGGMIEKFSGQMFEEIALEIQRSIEFFKSTVEDAEVSDVYLSGGCACTPNIAPSLSERLGINVETANPFKEINLGDKIDSDYIMSIAPQMCSVMGLALREKE